MKLTITKDQARVVNTAAKDGARPGLAAVCLRKGKMVAANGYVMAEVTPESLGQTPDEAAHDLLIPASLLKPSKLSARDTNLISTRDGQVQLEAKDATISAPPAEGTFPGYDQLWPQYSHDKEEYSYGFSREVLKTIVDTMPDDGKAIFRFYGMSKPCAIDTLDGGLRMIAMPIFIKQEQVDELNKTDRESQQVKSVS